MSERLFGTDGIRGPAGVYPVNPEGAYRLGRVVAYELAAGGGRVYVGRDSRPSGVGLVDALLSGLRDGGTVAVDLGVVPTPAVAHFVAAEQGVAGVAVSASHNPASENGFKLFGAGGEKLPMSVEDRVERVFRAPSPPPLGAGGRRTARLHAAEEYVEFAVRTVPAGLDLRGVRVVVDCARGATGRTTPAALRRLGAEVTAIAADGDGARINEQCGSLHPETVREVVLESGALVGLAHDGDGDRLVLVDERGRVVGGDEVLGLIATALWARGELNGGHVVGTILSNGGLERWLTGRGLVFHRSEVGDRNVWQLMRRTNADLGGEPSGHTILRRLLRTDDALLTALQVLALLASSGRRLGELADEIPLLPQLARNLRVRRKPPLEDVPAVLAATTAARAVLNGDGRLIVRYSGTEPVARILAEGPDAGLLKALVDSVAHAFVSAGLAV